MEAYSGRSRKTLNQRRTGGTQSSMEDGNDRSGLIISNDRRADWPGMAGGEWRGRVCGVDDSLSEHPEVSRAAGGGDVAAGAADGAVVAGGGIRTSPRAIVSAGEL